MAQFTARTMQVDRLFANPFLIEAPSYQRAFVWTAKEAGQLLDDVTAALAADAEARHGGEYFLGAMVFVERDPPTSRLPRWTRPRPRRNRLLEVVDGFQRLTTLTILICVLRDLGEADGEPANPSLLAAIRTRQGASARYRLSLGSPEEEEEDFFHAHVRAPGATRVSPETVGASAAEKHILSVREHFVAELASYDANGRRQLTNFLLSQCCVVLVTTTDIDRAHHTFEVLNARGRPLARNEILKALLLGSVPKPSRDRSLAIWKQAESQLGEDFEGLFSHIWSMHGRPEGKIIAGILKLSTDKGGAEVFIERVLQPAADIFNSIRNSKSTSAASSTGSVARYLRYLGWHSFADWIPPTMLWRLARGEDRDNFARLLAKLDRLAFGIRILGIGSSKRIRRFGAVATAIRDGHDLDGLDSPLEFSRQELRTIQHNLRDLHARNALAAKHLLLRLGDMVAGTPQSWTLPGDMTVEHVLPRKFGADSPWRSWYPDPGEREDCTESLGNLVLVTKAQNDRAGNLDFARKLEFYFATPDAPVPVINESLRGCTEWKPAQIKAREDQLLQLVRELWDFDPKPVLEPPRQRDVARGRKRRPGSSEERDGGAAP